jgi:pilus assembly protein Flp/PilA
MTLRLAPDKRMTRSMMLDILRKLAREDAGQDLIEYAMVAAIVALGSLAVVRSVTNNIKGAFNGLGTALTSAIS